MNKEQYSPRQTAAMKARMRRLRAQYRKRMAVAVALFFILGVVAGIFGHRWFTAGDKAVPAEPAVTPTAPVQTPETAPTEGAVAPGEAAVEPVTTPEVWAMTEDEADGEGLFLEDEDAQEAAQAEQNVFPEVDGEGMEGDEPFAQEGWETFVEDGGDESAVAAGEPLTPQVTEAPAGEETAQAQANAAAPAEDAKTEEAGTEEAPTEEAPAEDAQTEEAGTEEAPTEEAGTEEAQTEEAGTEEAGTEEAQSEEAEAEPASEGRPLEEVEGSVPEAVPAPDMSSDQVSEYDPEAGTVPEDYYGVPDENGVIEAEEGRALNSYGPQVIAIVPFGESFTYTTEINEEGNARVEATDAPYETVSFTQTMKSYMRPVDFANRYATQYKLQGDEAGAGFELILNDYTGDATIVPQNVIDVGLRSESGNTVERGYQLMDAEIAGNYGVALTTNTPTTLYKRFQYSTTGEEMAYLVVTTYVGGETRMILFELEGDEVEAEPEVVYTILQKGLEGDEVLSLQSRLIELGYLSGAADGSFGKKTEDAIKEAQAAFGMEQTGIADSAFQAKLYEGAAPTLSQAGGYVTLSNGATGDAVKRLQKRLQELGYYTGRVDGGFGPMMVSAVQKAQAALGMAETGVADSDFQAQIYAGTEPDPTEAPEATPEPENVAEGEALTPQGGAEAQDGAEDQAAASGYPTLDTGSVGDAVKQLQRALMDQGYYEGRLDGGYGQMTVDAVKKAQAAFGMKETGIADDAFQQRLFLKPAGAADTVG